ncbi:condensation domain-containing protein, partial [Xanthomonas arboricola]|uniref:condensation domain-containing protein n=1 Tax=Xanthomonas arboricola TaxID=56448 RepID=UPI000D42EE38
MNDHQPIEPIAIADRNRPLRASLAQQRLWFLSRLKGADRAYYIHGGLRLRGALDRRALLDALDLIVQRHETLRTTFRQIDGDAYQSISAAAHASVRQHDLSGVKDAGERLRDIVGHETTQAFDLERGPLVRGCLIRLSADEHVLLITMHHIVSDAWSMGILTNELGALYYALSRHQDNPLPPLRIQFADHAEWQRERLEGARLEQQLAYWRRALADAPATTELPGDRPRPPIQSYRGGSVGIELDPQLVIALKACSRAHGVSMFTTLLAGWSVLLSRLSRQSCVLIGSPTANRFRKELEGLIGFFVNVLVLRIDIDADASIGELLRHAGERVLQAQQHADVPFEYVVEALKPPRSLAHTPLFQAAFVWQSVPKAHLGLPGLSVQPLAMPGDTAQFDVTLTLGESGDRIIGTLNYASDLFDADTIARWAAAYAHVLRQIVEDPQRPLATLSLLDAASRRQVVQDFNATDRACADGLVHTLFEAQVARTPDAIAAVDANEQVSYAALDRRANRLARHLRACGVGPEHRVAVSVERGVPLLLALLATLKAGGAYVPLDPDAPPQRLAEMLHDSRPTVVLQTQRTPVPAQLVGAAQQVWLDQPHTWAQLSGAALAVPGLTNAQLAYVIYTSGSTGRPKGVMNAHRGVVNRLRWMQDAYALQPGQSVLQKTPCGFDVSVWEFFWPLLAGARLVFARPGGHRDPGYLHALIEREGIDTLHFVPSMLDAFVEAVDASSTCASLTRVFCSGEALSRELAQRFAARW